MNLKLYRIGIYMLAGWLPLFVQSQPFGNEWINYNQSYYKVPVGRDGVYRLSYDLLVASGFPVSSVDPRRIQLFHRGREQSIVVTGQLDARFDPGDYIEFFGQKNDGTLDRLLYLTPEDQPHDYYNLFSDTTFYFLTWRLDGNDGRRMPSYSENNVTNIPAEDYLWTEKLILQTNEYSPGRHYPLGAPGAEVLLAGYDQGEGWTGPSIRKGNFRDFAVDSLNLVYPSGPLPRLTVILAGRNNLPHGVEIFAGPATSSLRSLGTLSFSYHDHYTFTSELEFNDISPSGELIIRVAVNGVNATDPDFVSVSLIRLTYPKIPDVEGTTSTLFVTEINPSNKSYLEISNVTDPVRLWDITNADSILQIGFNYNSSVLAAILPNTTVARTLWIDNGDFEVPRLVRVNFRRVDPSASDYLIITHPDLQKPGGNYQDPVTSYAAYRASPAGGNYDTLVVTISQLYDLFSFGEYSPLSIRRFCEYMSSSGNPRYLFLIGKSLYNYFNYYRTAAGTLEVKDLVPTFGYPGSDALFSSGLSGSTYEAGIPTGRISVQHPDEVAAYLDKIVETENFTYNELWKKDLIHLSGGITPGELTLFKSIVEEFAQVAEDKYLGGEVITVSKETNNSVELINISDEVNKGKLMITFFGHSASNIIDIDIGYVSDPALGYNNRGKYPFILVNGCNAGNMFNTLESLGEDWISTPEKGAIHFLAHAGVGLTTQLKRFTSRFYSIAFSDTAFMNQSIGQILAETGRVYLSETSTPSQTNISQVQQNNLQGDPAGRLFGSALPDYSLTDVSVYEPDNQPVTILADSIDLRMIITNTGRVNEDSFFITVSRELPDGSTQPYDPRFFRPVFYRDTLNFRIYNGGLESYGTNRFSLTLDPFDSIPEITKLNNSYSFEYFISKPGTQNLLPYPFAIVNQDTLRLITQATDLLSGQRSFVFQADTLPDFSSPALQSYNVTDPSVSTWDFNLFSNFPPIDSLVFYWRTNFTDNTQEEEDIWSLSSFYYLNNGPEGWAQAHPGQFLLDQVAGMIFDPLLKKWGFEENSLSIKVTTFGADHPDKNFEDVTLLLDGIPYIFDTRLCTENTLNAIAFDYASTNPYLVLKFGFYDILDRRSCGRQPQVINNFLNSEILGTQDYLNLYLDSLKTGDYVLLFTIGNVGFESWPNELRDRLSEIGVHLPELTGLVDGEPLIILGRKGSPPGTATVIRGSQAPITEAEITLENSISGSFIQGSIRSTLIGPASSWGIFSADVSHIHDPSDEMYHFDIFGVDPQNNELLIFENIPGNEDLSALQAGTYPYLRLKFTTENLNTFTPAQLNSWMVTYESLPEGILLPGENQELAGIEKQEGENFESKFLFRNISTKNFKDSLRVEYDIFNRDTRQNFKGEFLIGKLPADSSRLFSVPVKTIGFPGINDLSVEVNQQGIPELYSFNNSLNLPEHFTVIPDQTHPLVDVAFDGRYILDGEIVSPSPLISIRIKDDNKILIKQDTNGIDIRIKYPNQEDFSRISLNQEDLKWSPATAQKDFLIEYQPSGLEDGLYTLQVQAADASGNLSGTQPYSIRFEVINESSLTNFYPYPNPFSTSVRFVFTLTGLDIPDEIKIQIMTISGKVVREIFQEEIGPIHTGNNLTEYAWDGKDDFGDQLANGVYLYRVIARVNGKSLPLRETSGDKAFNKGFGKLYLLR